MSQKVTPRYDRPHISKVYENLPGYGVDLYVGGREGASDVPLLLENGISTVLNCAVNLDFNYVAEPDEVSHDSRVGYGAAPIRYYKLGIVDGPGNPDTMMLAGYYQLRGALDQVLPERPSYPTRQRGHVLVNCRAGRSRSVVLAALFLHLHLPGQFPRLPDALDHVREKRELRPDEWHETPKPMLIAAAERTAHWVHLIEADRSAEKELAGAGA
ncbi:protein phosphatase [Devosia sp.]|uniref:protein phosphatase n=1 Tax=Devosia sp. TaxID=1871048 RepID=UPI002AFFF606|nr:protein phosphatase [Devosia sp.]